jgi:hypothetical protein
VAIVKARPDGAEFRRQFEAQFAADAELGKRVSQILNDFFREPIAPGYLLYEEYLAATLPAGATTRVEIRDESAACASYFAENPAWAKLAREVKTIVNLIP